ncbi:hypothetical protein ANANG_G00097040 [Anguilla anguilla]|uniref:SEA domain-containing protein n=1 Tax=Anguilla anguilla TaxID=7936 RepID=A0A9D3MHV1_ANGAN|nr:hypothetical protein ANANG_G00097040 [Anguilla anguilla]
MPTTTIVPTKTVAPTTTVATTTTVAPTTTVTRAKTTTKTTTKAPARASNILFLMYVSFDPFQEDYNNRNSQAFKKREKLIKDLLEPLFKRTYPSFVELIIISFRRGSTITESQMIFSNTTSESPPTVQNVSNVILKAYANTSVSGLNITDNSLNVSETLPILMTTATPKTTASSTAAMVPITQPATESATTATTRRTTTTATTTKTTVNPTTTSSTVPPVPPATAPATAASTDPPIKEGVLLLSFRLFRGFTPQLQDQSSSAFLVLARNVTTELNRGYRRAFPLTFLRSIVIAFRRGPSFIRVDTTRVETKLIFKNQSVVPNITIAVKTLVQALENAVVFLNIIPGTINAEIDGATTTASSAMSTSKPQEVVTFLFPLILVIYSLSTNMKLLQF